MDSTALIYRHAWDAPRDHDVEFAVYSHGVAERMPAGRVRQVANVDDWLLIIFHDAAVVRAAGREIAVNKGEALVWSPGQARDYGRDDAPWVHTWVQFSGRRVRGVLAALQLKSGEPWQAGRLEVAERGVRRLHAEQTTTERPEPRILGNLFENWLLEMRRSVAESLAGGGGVVDGKLRALKTRLDMEHGRTVSLGEMAKWAGMSQSHLSAVFKARYGVAPVAYHIARRMDAARYLLSNRSVSVGEAAEAVGYPELAAFSRMFKRVVGVGPRAYRERDSTKQS